MLMLKDQKRKVGKDTDIYRSETIGLSRCRHLKIRPECGRRCWYCMLRPGKKGGGDADA